MKRGLWPILALLLAALLVGGNPALAKKSGSSFSSGGRSSTTTRSSGWSNTPSAPQGGGWSNSTPAAKPSAPSTSGWGNGSQPAARSTATTPSGTNGGWSNSSGASATSGSAATSRSSFAASGQTAIQKESSRKAYTEYQERFSKPDNPVNPSATQSVPAPAPKRTWDNYQDYRDYRESYYEGRGWSAPGYAYRSYPSFGLWDAMFLWFMLRQASGPSFMYNHQDDPGVKAFRQEADRLAQDNADLKKQLADLDAKVDQMRSEGVKPDPASLPSGVDPSVALAAEKVVKERPESSGIGTWLLIACAAFGVAALFLLATRRQSA